LSATDTTKDTIAINGGAGGVGDSGTSSDGGAKGADIIVGSNATINITETLAATSGTTALTIASHISSIDLGDITGTNVNINATTLNGVVTIDSVTGNSTISTGAGADVISAGTGVDTINSGSGNDVINTKAGADIVNIGLGSNILTTTTQESTVAASDVITGFNVATASWTGSSSNNTAALMVSTGVAGATADILDLSVTSGTLAAAGLSPTAGTTATSNVEVSALGLVTFAAADDTLTEQLVAVAADATDVGNAEAVFWENGGNTYVFVTDSGSADTLVTLVGVTGVTGLDGLANSGTVGGDGYIMMV